MKLSHIEIETTNRCQLSCAMCPHGQMKRGKGFVDFDLVKKVAREAAELGAKTSYLHQIGEPLLHPQIIPIINYVAACGIRTSISTNGMLLGRWTRRILESDLDEITLCLDSTNEAVFNELRVGGNFKLIKENIDNFIEARRNTGRAKPFVQVQLIDMALNHKFIDGLKSEYTDKIKEFPSEILIKSYSTFAGFVKDKNVVKTAPRRFKCSKPFNSLTINWDGSAVVCCRDFDHYSVVGNANTESIKDIWNSDKINSYRQKFKAKDFDSIKLCGNC